MREIEITTLFKHLVFKENKWACQIKNIVVFTFIFIPLCCCKAQNTRGQERLLYTLENYEYCLFYDNRTREIYGINTKKLDCPDYHVYKKNYTYKSKELLLKVIKKRYSDESLKELAKKKVLFSLKRNLDWYTNRLKDSANFIYKKKFLERNYMAHKRNKKKLENALSNSKFDTIPRYKNEIASLYDGMRNYKIGNALIHAVAYVIEKEKAIPFLKELLKDTLHINNYAVKFSLAKLEVEPYYTSELNKLREYVDDVVSHKDRNFIKNLNIHDYAYSIAEFLRTKEAILSYVKILEAKYFDTIDKGDYSLSSIPVRALEDLLDYLIDNADFKTHYEGVDTPSKFDYTKNDIEWAIKWFKKNKDRLEIKEQ